MVSDTVAADPDPVKVRVPQRSRRSTVVSAEDTALAKERSRTTVPA
jgi:hypothetical protein